jgi:hypothetical protein
LTHFLLISDGEAASLALNGHCVSSKFSVAFPQTHSDPFCSLKQAIVRPMYAG